jgi:hypothetical protein
VAKKAPSALWTCPKCGAKLASKNHWHSCGYGTLDDWFARMSPRARQLYNRFEPMIAECGEYHVSPAKTRIAFLGRVRFAGISSISDAGMTIVFAMPYPLRPRRFVRVQEVVPGWLGHRLRVTDQSQLDRQLQDWLRRSYRLMGMQGRLHCDKTLNWSNRSTANIHGNGKQVLRRVGVLETRDSALSPRTLSPVYGMKPLDHEILRQASHHLIRAGSCNCGPRARTLCTSDPRPGMAIVGLPCSTGRIAVEPSQD